MKLERDPDCGRTADRVEHLHDFRLVRPSERFGQ